MIEQLNHYSVFDLVCNIHICTIHIIRKCLETRPN